MGKVKEEIQNLIETCERLYQIGGASAVIDYIEEAMRQGENMIISNVRYEYCEACDAEMPCINHVCLVCGQTTKTTKQNLVDAVIEDLKKGFAAGDYTVLDELLHFIPNDDLIHALPEEEWKKWKSLHDYRRDIDEDDPDYQLAIQR